MSANYLKHKSLCPLPFAGLYVHPNGDVKTCSIATDTLGNIHKDSLKKVLQGSKIKQIRKEMLDEKFPTNCSNCYNREKHHKTLNFDYVSNRLYHIKKLKSNPFKLYNSIDKFELQQLDLRWRNTCNGACVYCGSEYSSKWAVEVKDTERITDNALDKSMEFVLENLHTLKTLYLAGGEPFLIKENLKLLQTIEKINPTLDIRINTNLSNLKNPIFKIISKLPNVHWIISAESMEENFNYIRYPINWKTFLTNLKVIQKLPHKISINMAWNILCAKDIFSFIDYMIKIGIHPNAFILNYVENPKMYSVLNLPKNQINEIKEEVTQRLTRLNDPFMLKYAYEEMIAYLDHKLLNKRNELKKELTILDNRRNLNSKKIFLELYEEVLN